MNASGHSGEMFVIMDRLSYTETSDYFSRIYRPRDNFDRFLNSHAQTDKFYWYDVLGTKCLRERRYAKAQDYLSQIPVDYQEKLRVYPYMDRPPFSYNMETSFKDSLLAPNYKLHFAEAMAAHEQTMKHHPDPNKRAAAQIQYALGLRNSVHNCWSLTRYSSNVENDYTRNATPDISYPKDSTIYRHEEYLKLSEKLIEEAIPMFADRELAAQELQRLSNYKQILDEYGETFTAFNIRLYCDKWRDYVILSKKDSTFP